MKDSEKVLWITSGKDVHELQLHLRKNSSIADEILVGSATLDLKQLQNGSGVIAFILRGCDIGLALALRADAETDGNVLAQFVFLQSHEIVLKITLLEIHRTDALMSVPLEDFHFSLVPLAAPQSRRPFPGPARIEVPFQFRLPADLPSTYLEDWHNAVWYAVSAEWRGAEDQPSERRSCRRFFTVVQPCPSAAYLRPQRHAVVLKMGHPFWPCAERSTVTVELKLPVTGCAPGEELQCQIDLTRNPSTPRSGCGLHAEGELFILQESLPWLPPSKRRPLGSRSTVGRVRVVWAQTQLVVPPSGHLEVKLTCPALPSTFSGLGREGGGGGSGNGDSRDADPLVWRYKVELNLTLRRGGGRVTISLPLVLCSLGLCHVPALPSQLFWDWPELHPPVPFARAQSSPAPVPVPAMSILPWRKIPQLSDEREEGFCPILATLQEKIRIGSRDMTGGSRVGLLIVDPLEDLGNGDPNTNLIHHAHYLISSSAYPINSNRF